MVWTSKKERIGIYNLGEGGNVGFIIVKRGTYMEESHGIKFVVN